MKRLAWITGFSIVTLRGGVAPYNAYNPKDGCCETASKNRSYDSNDYEKYPVSPFPDVEKAEAEKDKT